MTSDLNAFVEKTCAKALSMSKGEYLAKNEFNLVAEPKYDGRRVFYFRNKDSEMLATKHNEVYTKDKYPELFQCTRKMQFKKIILDCEFIPEYQILAVFDLINLEGQDMTGKSYFDRRQELVKLTNSFDERHIFLVPSIQITSIDELDNAFERFVKEGFEGIVVKNPRSKYGQAGSWLKWKKQDTLDVIVTGRDPSREGASFFIAAYNSSGQLVDMGKVGSFTSDVNTSIIKEGTILEVVFQEITAEKHLRHPYAIRIRTDKIEKECVITA